MNMRVQLRLNAKTGDPDDEDDASDDDYDDDEGMITVAEENRAVRCWMLP